MKISALAHTPDSGPVELLYLLYHGVGGQAADMAPLVQRLAAEYPQAAVVCIDAPDPFDGVPGGGAGFQWFSIQGITEANRPERIAAAMPGFIAIVRQLQQHFDLPWERTALAGFSQGAIMALEAVQAEGRLAGRVLAFSGRHGTPPDHAPQDVCVHLFHGLADAVVPHGPALDSARRLVALDADVTADLLPGIGHELAPQLLDKAIVQLRSFIPKRLWREAYEQAPLANTVASSKDLNASA